MLICFHCQFENPDRNKFCQNCGNSLIEKSCPECHAKVSFNVHNCHNCGTLTGKTWLAVVSSLRDLTPAQNNESELAIAQFQQLQDIFLGTPSSTEIFVEPLSDIISSEISSTIDSPDTPDLTPQPLPNDTISNQDIEDTTSLNIPGAAPFTTDENAEFSDKLEEKATTVQNYIKTQQKRSVTEEQESEEDEVFCRASVPVPTPKSESFQNSKSTPNLYGATTGELQLQENGTALLPAGTYLDSQNRYQLLESLTLTDSLTTATVSVLDCNPLQSSLLKALDVAKAEIPAIAKPYLALKLEFPQNLPNLHDVLQENGQIFTLLEDCSNWPLLSDCWSDSETSTQQILYWLNEMTELWIALEAYQHRQSLLEITNLRVNPNPTGIFSSIRLQRLYAEPVSSSINLQNLGKIWQTLFSQSDSTELTALTILIRDINLGNIQTIESLRSRIETIHNSLQPSIIPTSGLTQIQLGKFQQQFPDVDEETATLPLPMQVYRLEDSGRTDVGRDRKHNEDFFSIWTQTNKLETSLGRIFHVKGLYILCDGMGGHSSGEVASQLAVESLKQYFHKHWGDQLPSAEAIREAVLLANKAIYEINQNDARSGIARMGTTLVAVLIQNSQVAVAHVGDSRLYRLRRGWELEKITRDHEVGQREINRGIEPEIAYSRPDAYQLTQALGPRDESFVKPEIQFLELTEDTLFILASDGLTDNHLLETHGKTKLESLLSSQSSLDQGVKELIDLANQYNGHDNITAILIRAKVKPYR
ncbi:serine/threonine protein phosphatase [Oscillatoriales cyanobacterium USR001]|nr:serine/threonine protein phosphatase [Oscillatoriales cyanobacterium USR001]